MAKQAQTRSGGILDWFFALIVVAGLVVYLSSRDEGQENDATTQRERELTARCGTSSWAYRQTQDFVRAQLRSPSTADFPYFPPSGTRLENEQRCVWRVVGYVDAQNGFGATVRTYYTLTATRSRGDRWSVSDSDFYQ